MADLQFQIELDLDPETTAQTVLNASVDSEETPWDGDDSENDRKSGNENGSVAVDSPAWLASNLEHFVDSENIFNRQMVARGLLDALRSVVHVQADVSTVIAVLLRLSEDTEPSVRAELVEQVPHIAMFCREKTSFGLGEIFSRYLLPLVIKYVADPNNQVRRASHSALLSLMEQSVVSTNELEEQVCPVLFDLMDVDNLEHYRTEAVTLMSHLATLLNADLIRELFLDRFVSLSSDSSFQVRKVCATQFGDICSVLGNQITEDVLLPCFAALCIDDIWGVRKACAEVFVSVACVCSPITRRYHLAPLFVSLLSDESRWVQMGAFQALGPFISTFGDPNSQKLYYDEEGNVHIATAIDESSSNADLLINSHDSGFISQEGSNPSSPSEDSAMNECLNETNICSVVATADDKPESEEADAELVAQEDFSSFLYWRQPIPDLGSVTMDLETDSSSLASDYPGSGMYDEWWRRNYQTAGLKESPCRIRQEFSFGMTRYRGSEHGNESLRSVATSFPSVPPQDIVPHELLEQYIRMTDLANITSLDVDVVRYCAHSLPAVTLTLGRKHWPILRHLYGRLACDVQWKVRRTLAFSIHELAAILGMELAALDLVPVFDGFIRDLDEVRIGILRHLTRFLGLLPVLERNAYLPKIKEFLVPENERYWRFRLELAEQLSKLGPLFSTNNVAIHLFPIAVSLLDDRVAEVRRVAARALSELVQHADGENDEIEAMASELVKHFARGSKWIHRQTYALVCALLWPYLKTDFYVAHLLPALLELCYDSVANVRLTVAKALAPVRSNQESHLNGEELEVTEKALQRLKNDVDRDVRQAVVFGCSGGGS